MEAYLAGDSSGRYADVPESAELLKLMVDEIDNAVLHLGVSMWTH